jgi:nitroimidazol reductase NimA-like FMN-containing flavoprotein (pyridoxamine 5'-phosphate oxidase superfamily)
VAHEHALQMSPEEIRSLVHDEGYLVLGTLESPAPPVAEIARCDVHGEGLIFSVGLGSRSHRNIERDPRVCAVIENAEHDFYRMRSATIHGTAALVEEDSDRGEARYRVPLDDVVSFNFSKIQTKH